MGQSNAIRAGRAYVELFADDKPLEKGLQSAQQSLAKYSSQVAQVQKRLKSAEPGSSQAGQLSGVLAGLQERADTTQAALAGRQALSARLAEFKAIRNVDPYVGAPPAVRGGGFAGLFRRLAGGRAGSGGLGDMADDEDGSGYGTTAAKVIGGRGAAKWSKLAGGAAGPAIAILAGLKVAMIGVNAVQDRYLAGLYAANGQQDKAAELSLRWFESIDKIPVVGEYINTLFANYITQQKQIIELHKKVREGLESSMKIVADTGFQNKIAGMSSYGRKTAEAEREAKKQSTAEWQKISDAQSAGNITAIAAAKLAIKNIEQELAGKKALLAVEEMHRQAVDNISVAEAQIAAFMEDGVDKERELLALKQQREDADAHLQDAQDHNVNWDNFYRKQYADRVALERSIRKKEEADNRQAARALADSRIALMDDGFSREMASLKARHGEELAEYDRQNTYRARLVELGVLKEDALRKSLLERQANDEKAAVQRRDRSVRDMATNLYRQMTLAGREFTEKDWELFDLDKQLKQLDATAEQIRLIHGLFEQMKNAQVGKVIADQLFELDLKIALAADRIKEWDAQAARFAREHPDAGRQQVEQYWAVSEKSNLADFVKEQTDGLKTPLEKFKEFREKVSRSVELGLLDPRKQEAVLAAEMARLMGGRLVQSRGSFNAAEARGMAYGDASNRLLIASEQTAKNTRKLVDRASQGGRFT